MIRSLGELSVGELREGKAKHEKVVTGPEVTAGVSTVGAAVETVWLQMVLVLAADSVAGEDTACVDEEIISFGTEGSGLSTVFT